MAERRMMTKKIIHSDSFLDMPSSTQNLYFHLLLEADDEGFVNSPKRVQRTIGASDDDAKILLAKNFIIGFESGVIVIKHWRMHNYIQNDRFKATTHTEEKAKIRVKQNNVYTLDTNCTPSIGKDRLGKVSIGKDKIKDISYVLPNEVDKELFEDFLQLRKKLKAPNTQRAINGLINKLNDFIRCGHNPNNIIQASYENGWKGLFEPKGNSVAKSFKQQDKEAIDNSIDNYYKMKEQGFSLQEELTKQAERENQNKGGYNELN